MDHSLSVDALDDCERRFRSAFSNAAIGMTIIDPDGKYAYANEVFLRILGYLENELVGLHYSVVIHPDDRAQSLEAFRAVVEGGRTGYVNERRLVRKDGGLIWARVSVSSACDAIRPTQMIALIEDITDRKRMEDALRTSEERFRIASENASDLVFEWDLETNQVKVFGPAEATLGGWPVPRDFASWEKIVHPDDLARLLPQLTRHIETGKPYRGAYRVLGRNGQTYHYANRGQAIRNAEGRAYKWIGLATDITEQKRAEESLSQLAAIVQYSEDAIIGANLYGIVTTWNEGARKMLGYRAEEVLGKPISDFVPAPGRVSIQGLIEEISLGAVRRLDEVIWISRARGELTVSLTISPIKRASGEVTGVALIAHDITDRKKVEEKLAHQALHDSLTGLPNRLLLVERLAAAIDRSRSLQTITAAIYIDLDGFKFVNDTLGHEVGDTLLQQAALRLGQRLRPQDTLARMGGDEFMLVVSALPTESFAGVVAERMAAALREPFSIANRELHITASMGISLYPRDGADVSTLARHADSAMYQAKRAGKNCHRFFLPEAEAVALEGLELESEPCPAAAVESLP